MLVLVKLFIHSLIQILHHEDPTILHENHHPNPNLNLDESEDYVDKNAIKKTQYDYVE